MFLIPKTKLKYQAQKIPFKNITMPKHPIVAPPIAPLGDLTYYFPNFPIASNERMICYKCLNQKMK